MLYYLHQITHVTLVISHIKVFYCYFNCVFVGAYTLVTEKGNIIVNGILTSCYASADHDLAHIVITPIRWYANEIGWIFGQKNGYQGYANILEEFSTWLLPIGQI